MSYKNGYSVFLLNNAECSRAGSSVLYSLWQKELEGVILCCSRLPQEMLWVYFEGFPQMVLVNRDLETLQPNVTTINVVYEAGAKLAMWHLLENGWERIVFIARVGIIDQWSTATGGLQGRTDGFLPCI